MKHCFTICVDMDDTIENLLPAWLNWLNSKYNHTKKVGDVKEWEMDKVYPNLTWNQIFEPLTTREFWKTVQPKQDAIEYLQKLKDEHQDIKIVTSARYDTFQYKIEEVILKHFPMINYHDIILSYNKPMINCDIMIDDNINNLLGGNYYKLLYDTTCNRTESDDCCKRVYSWKEIYNFIHNLDFIYIVNKRQTIDY